MLCDKCGKNNATVFVKQVINNKETTQHLCEQCASEIMDIGNFSLDKFFNNPHFGSPFEPALGGWQEKVLKCPVCGMSYADFSQTGKLGCSECYNTFSERILPMVRSIHGKNHHVGKVKNSQCSAEAAVVADKTEARPVNSADEAKFYEKIALQKQLQDLVMAEKFEEAAQVRDKIKAIDDELNHQANGADNK